MKQHAKQILKNPLIYGSGIFVIGNLIANVFNYLFLFFMGHTLSVADFGVLGSIMALVSFTTLFTIAIAPMIVRFGGNYFATGELNKVRGLYIKILKLSLVIAAIIFIVFLLLIPQFSEFFKIKDTAILVLTDIISLLIIVGAINTALIQAKLAFKAQVIINIIGAVFKLILGIILVLLGFSVVGATVALLLSALIAYIVSFQPIKFIFDRQIASLTIDTKELFKYGIPSALTYFGLTSFISADILLVKHFFDPTAAGLYAGLSLVGRVIFYITSPIGSVMFPIIVQKHSRNENFVKTFQLALLLVIVPSACITFFYFLFPHFSITFFLKSDYLKASSLLVLFSIFICLYNVLSILAIFYLSIKKTMIFVPILLGAFLQVILIWFYHQNFSQIILISLSITFSLIVLLLLYYPYATKK